MRWAIEIEHLSKTYPARWPGSAVRAVNDITLQVAGGEAFGFIGANGAGKSTTIKVLTGALRGSSGGAKLFSLPVVQPEARRRVGYVPENPCLYDYLTPMETLRMGLRLHGCRPADETKHCTQWLERFGLAHVAHKAIRGFSKGMTQRVALAHAMAIEPRLLILDEPLSGLDPIGRRDVVDILSEYKRGGGTLFFSSHVLHDVERLADRFGLIHQGQLRAVRSPAELLDVDDLVVVRSHGAEPISSMQEEFSGRWVAEIRRADLWQHLDELRRGGHVLIEVRPTLNLEQAFLRVVRES